LFLGLLAFSLCLVAFIADETGFILFGLILFAFSAAFFLRTSYMLTLNKTSFTFRLELQGFALCLDSIV